jgi:hypothetical protein
MIATCLLHIKLSNIINDIIFITNTETLIHHSIIPSLIGSHKKETQISIPGILKNINLQHIQIHNIIIPKNVITYNWFIINKNSNISLINNKNIQQIPVSGTICTNFPDKKYTSSITKFSQDELLTLSLLYDYSHNVNMLINTIINKTNNVLTPQVIEINNVPDKSMQIIPNSNFKTYTSYTNNIIDKYYFINILPHHQHFVNTMFKKTMQKIITKQQIVANIEAIKDAQSNNIDHICIVDGSVLSDELFKVFDRDDINFRLMSFLLLIPDNNTDNNVHEFNNQQLTNFSYCINKNMYDTYLNNLVKYNDVVKAIEGLHTTHKNIFTLKYSSNLLLVPKNNNYVPTKKIISQYPKLMTSWGKELTKVKFSNTNFQIVPTIGVLQFNKTLSRVYKQKQEVKTIEPVRNYTIIQSVFSGSYLGKSEIYSILSFIEHNHIYHLYTYKRVFNAPVGCVIKNAHNIIPNGYNNKINAFKYKLLYMNGMYWVNLDVICPKKFDFEDEYVFLQSNDSIIKCPAGSKFALDCYNSVLNNTYNINTYIEQHKLTRYVRKSMEVTSSSLLKQGLINYSKNNGITKKNISNDNFNLENIYGKYNNVGVMIYWMPANTAFINEMESLLNTNSMTNVNTSTFSVKKNPGTANNQRIKNFIENDIYIYMFTRMLELKLIDNIHIIFGLTTTGKYLYNNEPLFSDGNYYNYNKNIHLWKLVDIKSILSFSHAKLFFYKGYGIYEHLYSWLSYISPNSTFIRYLATSFPLVNTNTNKIIIDDTWVNNDYANNKKCKLTNKNITYYSKHYTNYDVLLMDTKEKLKHYKILFPNAKLFTKLYKYSLMNITNYGERQYDVMFCASDVHPSKNWDIFNSFLNYCDKNNREMKVLIATPIVSNKSFDEYNRFKNVNVTVKKNLVYAEMIEAYNSCRCILITFGRDATPRAMTEASKCGCFNIVLDILSDGQDMIINNPKLGKIIHVPEQQKEYETSYKSIKCTLTHIQYDEMYNAINNTYDHKLISDEFMKDYDEKMVTYNLHNIFKNIIVNKNKMVVTLATENYTNNLNYLLSSIKHTNPNVTVLIYCVGWKNFLLNQFRNCYPNYYFREYDINNGWVKGDIIRLKVKVQREVYLEYSYGYIWIDADSIVLKNLDKLFDLIPEYNLACYYRPDNLFYMRFAVGVIIFGKRVNADMDCQQLNLEFINEYYNRSVDTKGFHNWFYDQTSLYDAYELYKHRIKLYEFTENEHSINDTLDTIIYSRRSENKYKLNEVLKKKGITVTNINYGNTMMVYS